MGKALRRGCYINEKEEDVLKINEKRDLEKWQD
jgi:hypothetical protein